MVSLHDSNYNITYITVNHLSVGFPCDRICRRHGCRGPSAVSALNMLRAGPIHVAVTRWYLSQPLQRELIILQSHYTK